LERGRFQWRTRQLPPEADVDAAAAEVKVTVPEGTSRIRLMGRVADLR
jgi:hypothetical protein